jgi:hypothetical protein
MNIRKCQWLLSQIDLSVYIWTADLWKVNDQWDKKVKWTQV